MQFTRTPIRRFEVLEAIILGQLSVIFAYFFGTWLGGSL